MSTRVLTEDSSAGEVKVTFRLRKEIIRGLKHMAADKDTNVTALVSQALTEFLSIYYPHHKSSSSTTKERYSKPTGAA